MAKRKKGTSTNETTSSNRFGSVIGLQKLLDNEKFDFILGLISFIAAIYIIIAFVSFLKTCCIIRYGSVKVNTFF